jgi:hypothetical protein
MRVLAIAVVFGLAAGLIGCRSRPTEPRTVTLPAAPITDAPTAKIWISESGVIELNGKPAELEAVRAALVDLAKRKGVVLYGRDAAGNEPHPNAMKVIALVGSNRLPIRLSTKRDFSDAVVPQ